MRKVVVSNLISLDGYVAGRSRWALLPACASLSEYIVTDICADSVETAAGRGSSQSAGLKMPCGEQRHAPTIEPEPLRQDRPRQHLATEGRSANAGVVGQSQRRRLVTQHSRHGRLRNTEVACDLGAADDVRSGG